MFLLVTFNCKFKHLETKVSINGNVSISRNAHGVRFSHRPRLTENAEITSLSLYLLY